MAPRDPSEELSERDRLVTRPDESLPTPLAPDDPTARGETADPKKIPPTGQGDPEADDPAPNDIDRTA